MFTVISNEDEQSSMLLKITLVNYNRKFLNHESLAFPIRSNIYSNRHMQGILTEGEGSVQLISSVG
jgi:hypothetical protein